MDDLQLVFLQYVGKTPSLAGCAKCQMKFSLPTNSWRSRKPQFSFFGKDSPVIHVKGKFLRRQGHEPWERALFGS